MRPLSHPPADDLRSRRRVPWTQTLRLPESEVLARSDGPASRELLGRVPTPAPADSPTRREYRRLARLMALGDAGMFTAAVMLTGLLWSGFDAFTARGILAALLAGAVGPAVFTIFRLYSVHEMPAAEEFRRLLVAVTVVVGVVFLATPWVEVASERAWIGLLWAGGTVLALVSRRLWHFYVWRCRRRGRFTFRTLIVGTNEEGRRIAEVMGSELAGYVPVGFVSPSTGAEVGQDVSYDGTSLPVVSELRGIRDAIDGRRAECLFVASSDVRPGGTGYLSEVARLTGLEFRVTSNLPEVLSTRLTPQPLGGVMALSLKPARLTGWQALAKRAFDLTVASIGVVAAAPLWAGIAIAIKLTSPGPVLFRQERVGMRGARFTCLKFRSMVAEAEQHRDDLATRNEADGPLFKLRDDPRITRVGRWLRRWSLDELPQLVNVLRGEMSIVGPRPPLLREVSEYEDRHFQRLEVPPGITGLWQVRGRSDVSFDEYVRLDVFYVENWSLSFDLYIVLKTVRAVLSKKGAY